MHFFLICVVLAEWTCYQGREVKEANEGEKEQSQESPRSKEGEQVVLFMILCRCIATRVIAYLNIYLCRQRLEMLQRRSREFVIVFKCPVGISSIVLFPIEQLDLMLKL